MHLIRDEDHRRVAQDVRPLVLWVQFVQALEREQRAVLQAASAGKILRAAVGVRPLQALQDWVLPRLGVAKLGEVEVVAVRPNCGGEGAESFVSRVHCGLGACACLV